MTGQWNEGDLLCPTCYADQETVLHTLRDCRVARQVWEIWFSGICTVLGAELWGLYHGLKMAGDLKFNKVWIGCDSKEALICLKEDAEFCGFSSLICKIRKAAKEIDHLQLEFIPREFNVSADFLAKLGFSLKGEELMFYSSPHVNILPSWLDLSSNLSMEHMCLNMHNLVV
ncbi:uncharacterized protein LOC133297809 [Gastrolobium bilobum]|uniref:uncharacterized protein LOC133297809 n=1 Tax=Gastrolobium bilobum TaxID=150636 RepID=UPI002AAF15BD|nr:uncharacterized protein LOC133297809 [Gastrolobium bilobum]